jgi:hypothetical protein
MYTNETTTDAGCIENAAVMQNENTKTENTTRTEAQEKRDAK